MNGGLSTTLELLTATNNLAAAPVLLAALDSPRPQIREGALRALLAHRNSEAQAEIVRRWHTLDDRWKQLIAQRSGWLTTAVRDAILSDKPELYANGCDAIVLLREFDLIPALINAAEDESQTHADLAAGALVGLADMLYEDVSSPRDYANRRDPQLVRQHVVGSLELSVARFERHHRREIVESFLILANRDNATLKRILQDPHDGAFLPVVDLLTHGQRPGLMRLALNYLDDPHAPLTAINVLAHRSDEPFLRHLLAKIGFEPTSHAKLNIKRMESIAWLRDNLDVVERLNDALQHAAVQLAVHSSMNRLQVFGLLDRLLTKGTVGGRRAASAALAHFKGNDANRLALRALSDSDAQVQANVLAQLRERGIPGALNRLIEAVDSPLPLVRKAARQCLAEFSFKRFLAAFDMLDSEVRRSTGALVRRVDPAALMELRHELEALGRSRRLRGIEIAIALSAVADLEEKIIGLLADDDHFVRVEAALALAHCDTPTSRQALREALLDRSVTVQEAAESSLLRLGDPAPLLARRQPADAPRAEALRDAPPAAEQPYYVLENGYPAVLEEDRP